MFNNSFETCRGLFFVWLLLVALPTLAEEAMHIPLESEKWATLSFSKIPSSQVKFQSQTMSVKVKGSAGPIVYRLESAKKIAAIAVTGTHSGQKKLETGPFDEDSILRFGLVGVGTATLSGPRRWLAADWVKKLFSLAPSGLGLDKIYFFNVTNRLDQVGKVRNHPKSELLVERVVLNVERPGAFQLSHTLAKPIESIAIWLSIDGDDSDSEFETVISAIRLEGAP